MNRVYELPIIDFMRPKQGVVIEWKNDSQAEGPSNIEQLIMIHKKNLKNIIDYGIILPYGAPSQISRISVNPKYNIMFDEVKIDVPLSFLNFSYNLVIMKYVPDIFLHNTPHFDESDLVAGGNVFDAPLMYESV